MTRDQMIRNLKQQGFTIQARNSHIKMRSPEGHMVSVPNSMGKGRALKNMEAELRRIGYSLCKTKVGGRTGRS